MAQNNRQTGSKAASAAGKVLANPKSSKDDKKAAQPKFDPPKATKPDEATLKQIA